MRKLLVFVLSLLTLVGGHILNRRNDKALLFFSLLLLVSLANLFLFPLLSLASGLSRTPLTLNYSQILPITILASLGIIALASAVVSYLDAGKRTEGSAIRLSAIFGGLFSVPVVLLVAGYMVMYASLNLQLGDRLSESDPASDREEEQTTGADEGWLGTISGSSTHFWHNVRYSSKWIEEQGLAELPAGDAYLSGQIVYNNTPAAGVTLNGIFNAEYISGEITTDEDGEFTFRLPAGDWQLNRINIRSWSNKPARGSFSVLGTANTTLSDDFYHEGPEFRSQGLMLTASEDQHSDPKLKIVIRDNIAIDWPNRENTPAALAEDSIGWQPVTGAARYQVQLQQIEREGTTTSYYPVYWENTDATSLPLERIQTIRTEEDSANEYQVVVYAFDPEGRLLSSSPPHRPIHSLALTDRKIPSFQRFPSLRPDMPALTEEEIEQMQEEKEIIDTAMVLAKREMPAAARALMAKLTSNHQEKRRDTLEGLILTAEGQCEAAREHFAASNKKWKRDCLPEFYKQRCLDAVQPDEQ